MLVFRNKRDTGSANDALRARVVEAGPGSGMKAGAEFPLESGDNLIGRDNACDIVVLGTTVSRRHAKLHVGYRRRDVTLGDLGGLNGTLLRPSRMLRGESVIIEAGAEFQVGEVLFRLVTGDGEADDRTMAMPEEPAADCPTDVPSGGRDGD